MKKQTDPDIRPTFDPTVDYLECKNSCLDAVVGNPPLRYCSWFSVNYNDRICLLFDTCDSLISLDGSSYNDWHSSNICCDYYIEQ